MFRLFAGSVACGIERKIGTITAIYVQLAINRRVVCAAVALFVKDPLDRASLEVWFH